MSEPTFKPKPGQIDYTQVRYAPVINCVLMYKSQILLVKRSSELRLYPGYWNGVSGFLDDSKSLAEKVEEEVAEEVGISKSQIQSIKPSRPLLQEAPEYHKTWLVVPVLVKVSTDKVKLDREAEEARWFKPSKINNLKLLPGFKDVITSALGQ